MSDVLSFNPNEKVSREVLEHKLKILMLDVARREVQLGHLIVFDFPSFSTTFQINMEHHLIKKHNASKPKPTHDCQEIGEKITNFQSLRRHKSQHKV